MTRLSWALVALVALAVAMPFEAQAKKKEKDAPPPIEFTVLRKGKAAGTFSYKVATFSGKYFSSSQLELNTSKGTLAVMTHVEKDGKGKLLKYRKWVGNEGARPDIIAFWKGDKLRVVSKLKGKRFTRDLEPAKGFEVLDQLGFHLYGDLAEMWVKEQRKSFPAVTIHKGRLDNVTLEAAGVAVLKDMAGKEVRAQAVRLKSKSFNLIFFVGDKPRYLGFQSKTMVLVRKGWNLVGIEEGPVKEVPAEETPAEAAPEAGQPEKETQPDEAPAEETPVEEAPAEKAPAEKAPEKEEAVETTAPDKKAAEKKEPAEKADPEKAPKKELPPLPD